MKTQNFVVVNSIENTSFSKGDRLSGYEPIDSVDHLIITHHNDVKLSRESIILKTNVVRGHRFTI